MKRKPPSSRSGRHALRSVPWVSVVAIALAAALAGCANTGSAGSSTPSATGNGEGASRSAKGATPTRPTDRATPDENPEALPDVSLTSQMLFQILAAEIAAQRGQFGSAVATLVSVARETRDPRLARRATEIALAGRAADRALPAAQLWLELAPRSSLAAQTVETLLVATGRLGEAEPLIVRRLDQARSEGRLGALYPQLQRQLTRAPDRSAAYALIERVSTQDIGLVPALLARAAVAQAAGQPGVALAQAQAAMALAPADQEPAMAAARYAQEGPGGEVEALAILERFVGANPKALEARFMYARTLASSGQPERARAEFEKALAADPESPAILFSLAQIASQTGQRDVARSYLERVVALPASVPRDNDPAYLFLGQIAEESQRYDEAARWYGKVGRGEQFLPARVRQALVIGRAGRVDEATALLRGTSVSSAGERRRLVMAEAQVLREARRLQEAYDVLGAALERAPDDPDLLYDRAMAAEKLGLLDVLETNLRRVIELRPDAAHAYNALGYTLADRNLRLEEAQKLIEKALSISPKDAHILDSMGWVLFRRGDLAGAERYLREALSIEPNAEVAAHLGEVLWQAGRADEARRVWRDARGKEPENEVLRETLARLNVSL